MAEEEAYVKAVLATEAQQTVSSRGMGKNVILSREEAAAALSQRDGSLMAPPVSDPSRDALVAKVLGPDTDSPQDPVTADTAVTDLLMMSGGRQRSIGEVETTSHIYASTAAAGASFSATVAAELCGGNNSSSGSSGSDNSSDEIIGFSSISRNRGTDSDSTTTEADASEDSVRPLSPAKSPMVTKGEADIVTSVLMGMSSSHLK